MAQASHTHSPLIVGPGDAADYLAKMDIQISDINKAIAAGELAAGNITTFHPVTAAGLSRWINLVGVLRAGLAEVGAWTPANPDNRPTSNHKQLPYTLSTVAGTDATGIEDHPVGPLADKRKGKSTAEAVNGTEALIRVDTLRRAPQHALGANPPGGNWFLVYHRAEDVVRLEVSLPAGFDAKAGQFTGWQVRVILPSWEPQNAAIKPLDVGGQDVDFQVREIS